MLEIKISGLPVLPLQRFLS